MYSFFILLPPVICPRLELKYAKTEHTKGDKYFCVFWSQHAFEVFCLLILQAPSPRVFNTHLPMDLLPADILKVTSIWNTKIFKTNLLNILIFRPASSGWDVVSRTPVSPTTTTTVYWRQGSRPPFLHLWLIFCLNCLLRQFTGVSRQYIMDLL